MISGGGGYSPGSLKLRPHVIYSKSTHANPVSFQGVWELPLVMWNDLKEGRCSMADACSNPPTAEGVYYMIMKNFQRHYNTNRAPFLLSYHPAW